MLKLEELKKIKILKLNEIVGGDNWQGMDKNDAWSTIKCSGNTSGTVHSDGSITQSCDEMTLD